MMFHLLALPNRFADAGDRFAQGPVIVRRHDEDVTSTLCGRLSVGKGFLGASATLVGAAMRPVCAAHNAAGHNAIRVSGPDHKLALEVLGRNGFS